MNPFDAIEKLITEHGSAAILRERITQAKEQQSGLEKENASLKAEKASLASELQQARLEIQRLKPSGFETRSGLLWKAAEKFPYCPECQTHPVMTPVGRTPTPRLWVCPHGHQFPRTA